MKRCPFCHEHVSEAEFQVHCEHHTQLRSDGQHNDYVTLPVEERSQADGIDGPRWYTHWRCREDTGMPEEIIRSYLADPFLYSADATYCGGCQTHVWMSECTWLDNGENLQTYTNALRWKASPLRAIWFRTGWPIVRRWKYR